MEDKRIEAQQFRLLLCDNMTIMFGGISGIGTPQRLIDEIANSGVKNLTLIGNDIAFFGEGIGSLVLNGQVKKIIVSEVETNENDDITYCEIELSPKGTLAERIRCGANGFGGFLTQSGIGTAIEKGKKKIEVADVTYLIERPLRADLAIVQAFMADVSGNLIYDLKHRNLNPVIAGACDIVVVQCDQLVPFNELDPKAIITTGAFVDYLYCDSKY